MTSPLDAARETVGLWYVGERTAEDVVRAACDLLVAGFDSPAVCELAALSVRDAEYEVTELLPSALAELGIPHRHKGTAAARAAGLATMAGLVVRGALPPRELTRWAHSAFGHAEPAETLAELDDAYDIAPTTAFSIDDIDAQVVTEARRLAAS